MFLQFVFTEDSSQHVSLQQLKHSNSNTAPRTICNCMGRNFL